MDYIKVIIIGGLFYHAISIFIFLRRVKKSPQPQLIRPSHWLQTVTRLAIPGDFIVTLLALLDIGRIYIEGLPQIIINITGLIIYFCGMFLYSWASYSFTKKMPLNFMDAVVIKEHQLFDSGAFSIVRHPIYAGTGIALFGIGLALSNIIVLSWLLFLTPFFYLRVRLEESILVQHFGEKYEEYRKKVPMFLPFLKLPTKTLSTFKKLK